MRYTALPNQAQFMADNQTNIISGTAVNSAAQPSAQNAIIQSTFSDKQLSQ